MPLKFPLLALLAKIEVTYGVDAIPTGAANSIMVLEDVEISPLEGEEEERNLALRYLGNDESIPVGIHVMLTGKVEAAGAGAAGTVPKYGVLHRMCALSETITPTVKVEYKPITDLEESGTLYFYVDGILHKLLGARGTVSLTVTAKRLVKWEYQFKGLFVAASSAALPTTDFTGFQSPKPAGKTWTPTFTLHGFAAEMESFSLRMQNQVEYRELVSSEKIVIVDRKPDGEVSIETPPLATKDYFTPAKDATLGAVQLIHGTVAGNIVQLDAPKVQAKKPRYSNSQGVRMLGLDLKYMPNLGNDEFVITIK